MLSIKKVTILIAGVLTACSLQAQQAAAPSPVFVKPTPLQQEGRTIAGFGNEGFVTARYTIKADGTTDAIEILGGFTNPFYENLIQENIKKWTFTPGTVNGEARDFLNQEFGFMMRVSEQLAISPAIGMEVEGLRMAITNKDFATARTTIDRLMESEVHSVLDYALMNDFLASVHMGLGDPFAALAANKRATQSALSAEGVRQYMLPNEMLESALKRQVVLAATVRQQGEVLRSWNELDALYDVPATDGVMQWVETAKQQVSAPDQLTELGKIVSDGHWVYIPSHRTFAVADVREGTMSKIVAHCERRTLELEYQAEVEWALPASFGDCKLDFLGTDGTLFTLYEFAQ